MARIVASLLDQQSRDAHAGRAQARALLEAVEGMAKAHEFLGVQLREERRRSRLLALSALLIPVVLAGVAGLIWWASEGAARRHDAFRTDVETRLASMQAAVAADRLTEVRAAFDERTKSLAA